MVLIVNFYIYDLIYRGIDEKKFETFKISVKGIFAMTILGKMRYFLEIEAKQDDCGICIH